MAQKHGQAFSHRLRSLAAAFVGASIALLAPAKAIADRADPNPSDWASFRARFVTVEGRVIDNANNGVSHTEGQGYGMLLAAYYGDRPTFELMLQWTEKTLQHRDNHLFSWRYDPVAANHVADPNNATDGDLYIAWALARAGEVWNQPAYKVRAEHIAHDILQYCVVEQNGKTLLLPGANGFRRAEGTVLNLSYYSFAAMRGLAAVMPDTRWQRLEDDGIAIMRDAHFGPFALPPDWLMVTREGKYRPAPDQPARFSYDAVRVPLNLAWVHRHEPALDNVVAMWNSSAMPVRAPAWVSLNGNEAANTTIGAGIRAIKAVSEAEATGSDPAAFPAIADATEYYQAALLLISKMVIEDPLPGAAAPEAPAVRQLVAEKHSGGLRSWLPIGSAKAATLDEAPVRSRTVAPAPEAPHFAPNPWPDYAPFARPALAP